MIKYLLPLAVWLVSASPTVADQDIAQILRPCISEAINLARRPEAQSVNIVSRYKNYYLAYITSSLGQWGATFMVEGNTCSYVGDDFVNDIGLYGDLPYEQKVEWSKQLIVPRVEKVGKNEFKRLVREYGRDLPPYEVDAMRQLGLLD